MLHGIYMLWFPRTLIAPTDPAYSVPSSSFQIRYAPTRSVLSDRLGVLTLPNEFQYNLSCFI